MSCFVFRADGNPNIGLGHVMRCMSIADAAVEMGHDVRFVLADNSVGALIRRRGFSTIVFGSDYTKLDSELNNWSEINGNDLGTGEIFLIVDSYYVTENYLHVLKEMSFGEDRKVSLVYIDDLASFAYPVNVLLNYSLYADRRVYDELYRESQAEMPGLLLGVEFAPLRRGFRGLEVRIQRNEVRDVLISTGGSDPLHLALDLMSKLVSETAQVFDDGMKDKNWCDCKYHFLIGGMNEDRYAIREMASVLSNVVIHEDVSDMKSLISSMDIVVSAAGSTQFEVCACGVPMVTYAFADNQVPGMKALEERGLAVSVGDIRYVDGSVVSAAELILNAVKELAGDYEKRCKMGRLTQGLVDGNGAERCVSGMERLDSSDIYRDVRKRTI